jgi:hypothetical protein
MQCMVFAIRESLTYSTLHINYNIVLKRATAEPGGFVMMDIPILLN